LQVYLDIILLSQQTVDKKTDESKNALVAWRSHLATSLPFPYILIIVIYQEKASGL